MMRRGDYQWSLKTADTKADGLKVPGFICTATSAISEARRITKERASTGRPDSFGRGVGADALMWLRLQKNDPRIARITRNNTKRFKLTFGQFKFATSLEHRQRSLVQAEN